MTHHMIGAAGLSQEPCAENGELADKYASTSVAEGLKILKALLELGGPQTLKEISFQSGHSPSTTHRYLHALQVSGMVVQEKRFGRYELGPFATQLGIAAFRRVDSLNRAFDSLEELASETGCHVQIAIWTADGPVIVRSERAPQAVTASGIGTLLPTWKTASGRVFLAYLPRRMTSAVLKREFSRCEHPPGNEEVAQVIAQARRNGYAIGHGIYLADLTAMAAPLLDIQQQVCAVVSIINSVPSAAADNSIALGKLLRFCREKSGPADHGRREGKVDVSAEVPHDGMD